jgi:hypothetical protein
MSIKNLPLFVVMASLTTACFNKDDDTGSEEEESSEPSTEDTEEEEVETTYEITPSSILFTFQNGYVGNDIASVMLAGVTEPFSGAFSLILYDADASDFCAVDWTFDADSTDADEDYSDGMVADGFGGDDLVGWYGFTISSTPATRGSCDALVSDWATSLDGILADSPGFGYGPLTPDLLESMEASHPAGWENVSGSVFSGIASMTVFSSDGSRSYFGVNQGFAYNIENEVPAWDPSITDLPQGTEMDIADVPYAEGFYVGDYYFGLSFSQ